MRVIVNYFVFIFSCAIPVISTFSQSINNDTYLELFYKYKKNKSINIDSLCLVLAKKVDDLSCNDCEAKINLLRIRLLYERNLTDEVAKSISRINVDQLLSSKDKSDVYFFKGK